jgi:hypothetical protein
MKLWLRIRQLWILILFIPLLTMSASSITSPLEKTRKHTRQFEFDYVSWTLNAAGIKLEQAAINPTQILSDAQQRQLVIRYFDLVKQLEDLQNQIQQIFSDPSVKDPSTTAAVELIEQEKLQQVINSLAPMAESILQSQVSSMLVEMKISKIGDVLPPVLFHSSPLPKALIVSPRDKIEQDINISLLADLTLDQIAQLETQVEKETGQSALIVDVGGIGVYPTMVMRTSNLSWVIGVIAHEWTHNYLTLHPLGLNYDKTPELRTMNETTASIVGDEVGQAVLKKYYPTYALNTPSQKTLASLTLPAAPFDFRAEMHTTRVKVDELLSQGKISEAETYMEQRRQVFVQNGYLIRKLNQAYFAFYGAYAESPGGAAGQDPVGPAVRDLRASSASLADFLRTMARLSSFEELQVIVSGR